MNIRKKALTLGSQLIEAKKSYAAYKTEYPHFKSMPRTPLTKEDKSAIRQLWGKIIPKVSYGYMFFEIYKHRTDDILDPRFIPPCYMMPTISRILNPLKYIKAFSYKGLYPDMFSDFRQAAPIVQCMNSLLVDNNYRIITVPEAVDKIISIGHPVVIKGSTDTSGGKSVKVIKNPDREELLGLLPAFGKDYVVQEFVTSSPELHRLNPYSLSTMRIMTLALNGEITVHPSMLRIGGKDSLVDNLSAGGSSVGIFLDGSIADHSYAYSGAVAYESNGVRFEGFRIPNFDKVKEFVKSLHTRIPQCAIAGWDITLNQDNEPTFIEVNLNWPSSSPQICCGIPAFDNRTEEIIDYVLTVKREKPFFYLMR